MYKRMVACHDTAKALKKELPQLKVYWVVCKGPDIFGFQHLSFMHWNKPLVVKEFTGKWYWWYNKFGEMTGGSLRNRIIDSFKTRKKKNLKKLAFPWHGRKESHKTWNFPPGPPPPPPSNTAMPLPSDVMPHKSSDDKPGGVKIASTPSMIGKGGTEIKKKVLEFRPSDDILSWSVEIAKKKE